MVRGSFTWRVPSDRLNKGEPIESAPFDCAGQRWTLKLSPRNNKRCGVELRYAAKDVGDAVDAAFVDTLAAVERRTPPRGAAARKSPCRDSDRELCTLRR